MIRKLPTNHLGIAMVLLAAACSVSLWAGEPPPAILEFRFNETGTEVPSSGQDDMPLVFKNAEGVVEDLHGADGTGVSGAAGDRAFDNSAATGMGVAGVGGRAEQESICTSINGLRSFTLCGWYRTDDTDIGKSAKILFFSDGAGGFALELTDEGVLRLGVNGREWDSSSRIYASTEQWVFFAVTYDASDGEPRLRFYAGSKNEPVAAAGEALLGDPSPDATVFPSFIPNVQPSDCSWLVVGNARAINSRPFDGFLDNIRIYGTPLDGAGALTDAQLETLRKADTANSKISKK